MNSSRFTEAPETLVQTLREILAGRPILYVRHDEHGGWHFFDGSPLLGLTDLTSAPLSELLERDGSLNELASLPRDWQAWRDDKDQPWERESVKTKERTLARARELLERMRQTSTPLPPGSPSTVEMIREARGE